MQKQVLITGGAKRMGREIALGLASNGWDVALHYNQSEQDAEEAKYDILTTGQECTTYEADLTQPQSADNLLDNVLSDFPELSLLINNASIFNKGTLPGTSLDDFYRNLNIHLVSPFCLIQQFTSKQAGGSIINVLDTKISQNEITRFAYSISKKALADLTRMAALEFAPDFRVNGIAPGAVLPPGDNPEVPLDPIKCNPMKKIVSINSIVNTVLYLVKNEDITGQIISVDGGQNL